MLWDVVYDFFVIYIFGGTTSLGVHYTPTLGYCWSWLNGELDEDGLFTTGDFPIVTLGTSPEGYTYTTSLANYLSLIATIITMVAIVILCCLLIKKIYNICAHVIG